MEEDSANFAMVEQRRSQYEEWYAWVLREKEEVKQEREELGLPDYLEELELSRTKSAASGEGEQVVEELFEEVIEETEEFV